MSILKHAIYRNSVTGERLLLQSHLHHSKQWEKGLYDYVLFTDHAAAIATKDAEIETKDAEIVWLKDRLAIGRCVHCGNTVYDVDRDHWRVCPKHPANAEIYALREEVKNLNHMLDKAQVLRGDGADRFLEKVEAVNEMVMRKKSL
jgi:hypothetical protein